VGKFAASIERQKVKSILSSGGLAPYPSDQGALPLDFAGAAPPHPVYRGLTVAVGGPPTL